MVAGGLARGRMYEWFVTQVGDPLGQERWEDGEDWERGAGRLCFLSVLPIPDAAMPGAWLLLAVALTLTVAGFPGGRAQPEVAQQEAAMAAEHAGVDDLLRQAERLLLLREDVQRLRGNQGDPKSGEGQACVPPIRDREEGWRKPQCRDGEGLGHPNSCLSELRNC